jgi:hypothetical protein
MNNREFSLHHPSGITISPSLTEVELAAVSCSRRDMGTAWVWYQLPTFQEGEIIVAIALGFHAGRLVQLSLSDANPKFGDSWSVFSEHQERLRAQSVGAWLASKGLFLGTYSWGSVWAGYDPKGGFGSAVIQLAT